MAFEKFVCWDPAWVERVMNTEALQPERHVFLAVHQPVRMFRTSLTALKGQGERGAKPYSERELLADLLRPADFELVPVLGNAGTGKSHLVRWLHEHIPPAPNRHVLLIPKIDTNLWDVLHRILSLDGVKGDAQFDDYRSRLGRARGELRSEKEGREKLLNNLAVACGQNGPHKMQGLTEEQQYLATNLPNLLYDPFFREALLADGGIIDRLVKHTIGRTEGVERLDEKRGFRVEDLPLSAADAKRASAKARTFYGTLIGNDTVQAETVDWLNRHLSTAIAELLELRGDALLRLMLEVRETLGARGTELVLLIEDFAKLQGIDMQLLEAVIARPNQEGRGRLCAMRTVLACTKGYFRTLFDTVQTRVGFCVTLDAPAGSETAVTEAEVEDFVARYLNAVRLSESDLKDWLAERPEGSESETPPNACVSCQYRDECHGAFGDRAGVGLYPFTGTAVARMGQRASPEGFNPRFLLKDVLKAVLGTYADDLREGQFPSPALLEHFKGSSLSAAVKSDLSRLDTNAATRERRLALIDLWTNGAKVTDLHPGIHKAFALPLLGSAPAVPAAAKGPATPTPRPSPTSDVVKPPAPAAEPAAKALPEKLDRVLRQLDEWTNKAPLQQESVNELRPLVFAAVHERLNWDAEILVRGHFSGQEAKRPFRQRSVNFENQKPNHTAAVVRLTIPLDATSLTDAALALQGLLLFDHYGHWNFSFGNHGGSFYFRRYAQELDRWTKAVLDQIRRPTTSGAAWNPAPAAAELLALAARMANRPGASKTALDEQITALFQGLDSIEVDHRSPAWRELFKALRDQQSALADIVLFHAGCTKGGSRKVQVVDAAQLVEPLRAFRKDGRPSAPIPTDAWDTHEAIRKARSKADELLARATEEERARHLAWCDTARAALGQTATREELLKAVRETVQAAADEVGVRGVSRERLDAAFEALGKERLEQAFEAIERIRKEADGAALLTELGRDHGRLMKTVDEFVALSKQFLDATLTFTESEITQLAGAGELKAAEQTIADGLDQLHATLTDLTGG
jgi:hypothetical protein